MEHNLIKFISKNGTFQFEQNPEDSNNFGYIEKIVPKDGDKMEEKILANLFYTYFGNMVPTQTQKDNNHFLGILQKVADKITDLNPEIKFKYDKYL